MNLSVQLSGDAADALRGAAAESGAASDVLRVARELGIELLPLDPQGNDPVLSALFHATVDDAGSAQRIVDRLRALPAVESAFLKPPDALP